MNDTQSEEKFMISIFGDIGNAMSDMIRGNYEDAISTMSYTIMALESMSDLSQVEKRERIIVYTDGSGNGGYSALFPEGGYVEHLPKDATSNEAEYAGVILALKHMSADRCYVIKSDSGLVVNQLNKSWRIKEPRLHTLAKTCWSLMEDLNVHIMWIPREQNLADALLR